MIKFSSYGFTAIVQWQAREDTYVQLLERVIGLDKNVESFPGSI